MWKELLIVMTLNLKMIWGERGYGSGNRTSDIFIAPEFDLNKNHKMSSFKSNENVHKKGDGSYYVVSANKASSVTL